MVRVGLALGITVAFFAVARRYVGMDDVVARITAIGPARLALGIAAICGTMLLRAVRLCACLGERPTPALLSVSVAHNALVAVVPAKLGELGLPALLARVRGIELSRGVGVLVILRVFDLLALGLVGGLASAAAFWERDASALALILLGGAVGCTAALVLLTRYGSVLARTIAGRIGDTGGRGFAPKLRSAFAAFDRAWPATVALASVAIWISLFTSFFVLYRGILTGVHWSDVAAQGTAGSLAFALPVNGVANLGPFQGAWVAAGTALGITADVSLLASLIAHGAVLLTTVILGATAGSFLALTHVGSPPER